MSNYLSAPVDAGALHDFFKIDGVNERGRKAHVPLTEEESIMLAVAVNAAVETEGAVWFSRERDRGLAQVHGTPILIGDRAVHFVGMEAAVFPVPHSLAA